MLLATPPTKHLHSDWLGGKHVPLVVNQWTNTQIDFTRQDGWRDRFIMLRLGGPHPRVGNVSYDQVVYITCLGRKVRTNQIQGSQFITQHFFLDACDWSSYVSNSSYISYISDDGCWLFVYKINIFFPFALDRLYLVFKTWSLWNFQLGKDQSNAP